MSRPTASRLTFIFGLIFLITIISVTVGLIYTSGQNSTVLEVTFRSRDEAIRNLETDLKDSQSHRYRQRDSTSLWQTRFYAYQKIADSSARLKIEKIENLQKLNYEKDKEIATLRATVKKLQLDRSDLDK